MRPIQCCLLFGLSVACTETKTEGMSPGDCTDRADNDGNGAFDCDDAGCSGSPDCDQDEDSGHSGGDGGGDGGGEAGTDDTAEPGGDTGSEGGGEEGGGEEGGGDGGDSGGGEGGDSGGGADVDWVVCDDATGDYTDLQEAIDAAPDGARIGVCAGTWGPVEIVGRELSLIGLDGLMDTMIDGGSGRGLYAAESTLSLEELSIRGNTTSFASALYLLNSDTTLNNVRIAYSYGKSVGYIEGGTAVWDGMILEENQTSGTVFSSDADALELSHCVMRNNETTVQTFSMTGAALVSNCLFYDNAGSSVVQLYGDSGQVMSNVVFYNNTNADYIVIAESGAVITGAVYANNTSDYDVVYSGGAYEYSVFYNNSYDTAITGTGLSRVDPHFVDADAGDFTLDTYSPCIDAGNPLSSYDDADGSRNDIGAFGGPGGAWTP